MRLSGSVLLAALLACTREEPLPEARSLERVDGLHDPAAGSCEARVIAMREVLSHISRDPLEAAIPIPADFQPITLPGADPMPDGMPVFLHADGRFEFDNAIADVAEVERRLQDEADKADMLTRATGEPASQWALLLLVDERAPIAGLVGLLSRLPARWRPGLVVTVADDRVPPAPPTPAWVHEALVPDSNARTLAVGDAMRRAIGPCDAVGAVFRDIADAPPDDRNDMLVDRTPDAVQSCRCEGVDVEGVTAMLWALHGRHHLRTRWAGLARPGGRNKRCLKLRRQATGGELAARLRAEGFYTQCLELER